jgi:hypothetical protein
MVFHGRFTRKLNLLASGDLSPSGATKLLRHIAGCPACESELQELRQLQKLVAVHSPSVFDEQDLLEARALLSSRLASSRVLRSLPADSPRGILVRHPVLVTSCLLCALFLGVFSGRYLFPVERDTRSSGGFVSNEKMSLSDLNEVELSNLQILGDKDKTGGVEIVFDATRTMRVRGTPDDPIIQRVIARAIVGGDNPGIRMRAAANAMPRADGEGDREIKAALLLAVKDDPNDGVRKAAIEALLRYRPDTEIRDGLVRVLLVDKNPGLRVAAINGLSAMATHGLASDPEVRRRLESHLEREENLFVRTRTASLLKGTMQ